MVSVTHSEHECGSVCRSILFENFIKACIKGIELFFRFYSPTGDMACTKHKVSVIDRCIFLCKVTACFHKNMIAVVYKKHDMRKFKGSIFPYFLSWRNTVDNGSFRRTDKILTERLPLIGIKIYRTDKAFAFSAIS